MSETDLDLADKIVVFTTLGCPYSARLVKLLETVVRVPFEEVRISAYPVGFLALDLLLKSGGSFSIPCLFANAVFVGVRFFSFHRVFCESDV
jgi:glutaredoxin